MRPAAFMQTESVICFPRVSGDAPEGLPIATLNTTFSPRERGCARLQHDLSERDRVFPA